MLDPVAGEEVNGDEDHEALAATEGRSLKRTSSSASAAGDSKNKGVKAEDEDAPVALLKPPKKPRKVM